MEREKVIELFLGLILIILVIIMVLLVTNAQGSKSSVISNSYNTYNTKNYYPAETYNKIKIYAPERYPEKDYNYLRHTSSSNNLKYTSSSNHEKYYGILGNKVNEYKVYVKNREHKGGYFSVKFYLTDYYGKTRTEQITYYLKPHEEKKFIYKNVYNDGREYHHWRHEIVSHNKI